MDTLKREFVEMLASPLFAQARAELSSLESQSERLITGAGAGTTTWRRWGEGEHVVLIHGAYGSWRHWARNIARLAESYTVWAPDLPGHGDSELFDLTNRSMDGVGAALIDDAITFSGCEMLHLVGFSYGGRIVAEMAAHRPTAVSSVSLVGAMGFEEIGIPTPKPQPWRGVTSLASMMEIQRFNLGVLMIHERSRIDQLATYIQMVNAFSARITPTIPEPESLWLQLRRSGLPVRIVWGAQDVYHRGLFDRHVSYLQTVLDDFQVRLVPGAGHWLMYERPDAFETFMAETWA